MQRYIKPSIKLLHFFIMTTRNHLEFLSWFMKWFFIISQVSPENDCSSTSEASAEINDFSFKSDITPDNVSIFFVLPPYFLLQCADFLAAGQYLFFKILSFGNCLMIHRMFTFKFYLFRES